MAVNTNEVPLAYVPKHLKFSTSLASRVIEMVNFFGSSRVCDLYLPVHCSCPPGRYEQVLKLFFTSYSSGGSINSGLRHCTVLQHSIFSVRSA
jgi:hypothetical protein